MSALPLAPVRGRFAPTPSGLLHIGNAYTALFAWLQVRSRNGVFVLRIEDIDRPRSNPRLALQAIDDLRWLGLDWDEGPDVGGPFAPYHQSDRIALYEAAFRRLIDEGRLYPCYCSRAELAAVAGAPHGLASEGAAYPGTCRSLSASQRALREAVKTPSYRFALPETAVGFEDGIFGPLRFPPGFGGDFAVKRADGIFGYQLAVVVDDAAMSISDVLRGADLIDSTPRQLALYEALRLPPPSFAHIPLLSDAAGERLSKRHRSLAVSALRQSGIRPEALVGELAYLARMTDRPEPLSARDLIPHVRWDALPRQTIPVPEQTIARLLRTT